MTIFVVEQRSRKRGAAKWGPVRAIRIAVGAKETEWGEPWVYGENEFQERVRRYLPVRRDDR